MAIVTITLDQNDNSNAKKVADADSKPVESHTGRNIGLMFLMLSCAACALLHYCWPRIFWMVILVILSIAFFIWRVCKSGPTRFETIWVVPLNAVIAVFYIYWDGFHLKEDKDESLWRTMTKVDTRSLPAGGSSTSVEHKKSSKKRTSKKSIT